MTDLTIYIAAFFTGLPLGWLAHELHMRRKARQEIDEALRLISG